MTNNTMLEDKLEGAKNFQAWKYRVPLIQEEHDLEKGVHFSTHIEEAHLSLSLIRFVRYQSFKIRVSL